MEIKIEQKSASIVQLQYQFSIGELYSVWDFSMVGLNNRPLLAWQLLLCVSVHKIHQDLVIRKWLVQGIAVPQFRHWNLAKLFSLNFWPNVSLTVWPQQVGSSISVVEDLRQRELCSKSETWPISTLSAVFSLSVSRMMVIVLHHTVSRTAVNVGVSSEKHVNTHTRTHTHQYKFRGE